MTPWSPAGNLVETVSMDIFLMSPRHLKKKTEKSSPPPPTKEKIVCLGYKHFGNAGKALTGM